VFYLTNYDLTNQDSFMLYRNIDVKCPMHIHPQIEIVFGLGGKLILRKRDKCITIHPGTMAFIAPYEIHGYDTDGTSDMAVLIFPTSMLAEYDRLLSGKRFSCDTAKMAEELTRLVIRMLESSDHSIYQRKALIYSAMSELANSAELVEASVSEYDVFHNALLYMSEHFSENIRLGDVAKSIGVTAEHLCRVLSDKNNVTFCEILCSMRLHKATQLLCETTLPISEVSYESGFGSTRNFNRAFKSFFGVTPSEMRGG